MVVPAMKKFSPLARKGKMVVGEQYLERRADGHQSFSESPT